jgi:hypothetical protein
LHEAVNWLPPAEYAAEAERPPTGLPLAPAALAAATTGHLRSVRTDGGPGPTRPNN